MTKQILRLLLLMVSATAALWADDDTFLLRVAPQNLQAVLNAYHLELEDSFPQQNLYVVEREDESLSEAEFIRRVRRDTRVLGFEANQEVEAPEINPEAPVTPSPSAAQRALQQRSMVNFYGSQVLAGFAQQPAVSLVRLPTARPMATGSGIVAVIDTGVDPNHPLLAGHLTAGYDFTRNVAGASEMDDVDSTTLGVITQEAGAFLEQLGPAAVNEYVMAIVTQEAGAFLEGSRPPSGFGHGTMVAGLIRLTAPSARIMPLKAFSPYGTASLFNLIRAVYYAADNGAKVINMSFTLERTSDEFTRALNYAATRGAIGVAAAGNGGRQTVVYPAAYHNVLGVAATTLTNLRSGFSNYGSALVSLAAPGEDLVTIYPGGGYACVSGTSFSTPLVAGTLALFEQRRPGTTLVQAESALRRGRPATGELGAGQLDVTASLQFLLTQP